jgi:hypothetical protein
MARRQNQAPARRMEMRGNSIRQKRPAVELTVRADAW